jgi:DNA relaxase NicK
MVSIAYSEITRVQADVSSNTTLESHAGGEPLSARIDWLSFSFQLADKYKLDQLTECIRELLQVNISFDTGKTLTDNARHTYTYYEGDLGISYGYTSTLLSGAIRARLILPGQLLSARADWHIKRVSRRLFADFGAKCTRIDIAIDDYSRSLDFEEVEAAIKSGNIAGFQKAKFIESYGGNDAGRTIYLGVRRAAKYGRIYDRMGVTKGAENCIRYEVEYKQGLALAIFSDYINDEHIDSTPLLCGIIRGAFDFTIKKGKNLDRATRLGWWDAFLSRISGETIKVLVATKNRSIERTLAWLRRSVSKSILISKQILGAKNLDILWQIWEREAADRITDADRRVIEQSGYSGSELLELLLQLH